MLPLAPGGAGGVGLGEEGAAGVRAYCRGPEGPAGRAWDGATENADREDGEIMRGIMHGIG